MSPFSIVIFPKSDPRNQKKEVDEGSHPTDKKQKPVALKGTLYLASITEKVDLTSRMLSGCRHAP